MFGEQDELVNCSDEEKGIMATMGSSCIEGK